MLGRREDKYWQDEVLRKDAQFDTRTRRYRLIGFPAAAWQDVCSTAKNH